MATWKGTTKPPGITDDMLPSGAVVKDWIASGTGFWLLDENGGVYAVGGAPYLGSYGDKVGASDKNIPRTFDRIQSDGKGGYSILSADNATYNVGQRPPAPPTPIPSPIPTDPGTVSSSAKASVQKTLSAFGLNMSEGEVDNLTQSFRTGGQDQMYIDLTNTDQYKARFPAMTDLNKAGHHIDESTYIGLEHSYTGVMNAYGIPKEFQQGTIDSFIAGRVSPDEVNSRIKDAATAAYQSPPEVRAALASQYGLSGGDLISFFINPDKSSNLLQQRVMGGAQTMGAATQAGYGMLTKDEAERLGVDQGITPNQAQQGFNQLAQQTELFNPLNQGEGAIGREQQLNAQFSGNAQDQAAIRRRAEARKAEFSGGGGFAGGAGGISGVGEAH